MKTLLFLLAFTVQPSFAILPTCDEMESLIIDSYPHPEVAAGPVEICDWANRNNIQETIYLCQQLDNMACE